MADKKEKLFSDFSPASTEQWMEKVTADLKGADFEKKLVWKTNEGFKSLKAVKENRVGCIDMILYSFKDALYMEAQYNQILDALKVASQN